MLLIDKLSEMNKARFMGYAFRRFVQGTIDEVILNRIYAALESIPLWRLFELPDYYFDHGLGSLNQSDAVSFQSLWFVEIYYGDKAKRLHFDEISGKSYYLEYHQASYRPTAMGSKVANVIQDYLDEPD